MWRLRDKQLELDNRLRGGRNESNSGRGSKDVSESRRSTSRGRSEMETNESTSFSPKKRSVRDFGPTEGEGLRDDEVDEFLYSRTKRGRGAVGSRMDETGPYLPCSPNSKRNVESDIEEPKKKARVLLGPLKPHLLMSSDSSDDETYRDKKRKDKSKRHYKKQKSKDKTKDKNKKKRKEKKSKHHK